jgi:acetyl esterase/lipase
VIFLHGGFWRAAYDRTHTRPLAAALAAEGFAVCTPEFRKIGQPQGGWPGTFDDVAAAVDALPALIGALPPLPPLAGSPAEHRAGQPGPAAGVGQISGLGPVIFAGHSAGGHLALWAAARHRLPAGSPWHASTPGCAGVVALAAVSDLVSGYQRRLGNGAVAELLGGGPARQAARYALTDPAVLVPTGIPVDLVHGRDDEVVPCELSAEYAARARAVGDDVTYHAVSGADHFDVIDPLSPAWTQVLAAFCGRSTGWLGRASTQPRGRVSSPARSQWPAGCPAGAAFRASDGASCARRAPLAQSAERLHGKYFVRIAVLTCVPSGRSRALCA